MYLWLYTAHSYYAARVKGRWQIDIQQAGLLRSVSKGYALLPKETRFDSDIRYQKEGYAGNEGLFFGVDGIGAVDEFDLTVHFLADAGEGAVVLRNIDRRAQSCCQAAQIAVHCVHQLLHALFIELL